MHTGKEQEAH